MIDPNAILGEVAPAPPIAIPDATLAWLHTEAELLREESVFGGNRLRLFKYSDRCFVQETSDREEILLRGYANRIDAETFMAKRLNDHERQWDG